MFRLFKKKKQNKEEDDKEQLISDLLTVRVILGLARTEKEIIDNAIKYIETH